MHPDLPIIKIYYMLQFARNHVPEEYRALRKKRLLFTAMKRFTVIIPFILVFLLMYVCIDIYTSLWGEHSRYFLILDLSAFFCILVLAIFFYKNRVESPKDVGKVHLCVRGGLTVIIILWAAFAGVQEYALSGGYIAFLICLMVSGGLFLLDTWKFIAIAFCGIFILLFGISIEGSEAVVKGLIYIGVILGFSVLINSVNKSALTRAFILEWELEQKVEDRTRELKLETEKAKQSEILKSTFLANMSHEIRTPLNAILGFSNLLIDDKECSESGERYLGIIKNSGENLLDIVNEIIEVSRLEAGACEFFPEDFDLVEVLTEAVERFGGHEKVYSGDIVIIRNTDGLEHLPVCTDKLKIIQILNNLIGNAVKYTVEGSVTVSLGFGDDSSAEITIADDGPGIDEEQLEYIFDRFHQASSDPYGRKDGVGLGLTIVNGYVGLLGGKIEVESKMNYGTSVTVKLPLIISDKKGNNFV